MRHDDLDDRELVARYQQGDTAAGEALVARYCDDVRAYCFAVLGDADQAEDAVQTTFEMVLRRLPTFEGGDLVSHYIMSIARGRCLTARRRARRTGSPVVLREDHAITDGGFDDVDDAANLRVIFDQLPAREQDLLFERHVLEEPLAVMAHRRDSTPGSVAVMVHRALTAARLVATNREMWAAVPAALAARFGAWLSRRDEATMTTAAAAPASVAALAATVLVLAAPPATTTATTATASPISPAAAPAPARVDPGSSTGDVAGRAALSARFPDGDVERFAASSPSPEAEPRVVETWAPVPRTAIPGTDRSIHQDAPDDPDRRYEVAVADTEVAAVESTDEPIQEPVHAEACPVITGAPAITCQGHD